MSTSHPMLGWKVLSAEQHESLVKTGKYKLEDGTEVEGSVNYMYGSDDTSKLDGKVDKPGEGSYTRMLFSDKDGNVIWRDIRPDSIDIAPIPEHAYPLVACYLSNELEPTISNDGDKAVLSSPGNPTKDVHAVNKKYADEVSKIYSHNIRASINTPIGNGVLTANVVDRNKNSYKNDYISFCQRYESIYNHCTIAVDSDPNLMFEFDFQSAIAQSAHTYNYWSQHIFYFNLYAEQQDPDLTNKLTFRLIDSTGQNIVNGAILDLSANKLTMVDNCKVEGEVDGHTVLTNRGLGFYTLGVMITPSVSNMKFQVVCTGGGICKVGLSDFSVLQNVKNAAGDGYLVDYTESNLYKNELGLFKSISDSVTQSFESIYYLSPNTGEQVRAAFLMATTT